MKTAAVFEESDLRLTFDERWAHIVKWDDDPLYLHGVQRLQGAKAVDFIGCRGGDLHFFELKNYGDDQDGARGRAIVEQVAEKVRYSLLGLAAARRADQSPAWVRDAYAALGSGGTVFVHAVVVLPRPRAQEWRHKRDAHWSVQDAELKRAHRWLPRCTAKLVDVGASSVPGVTIVRLARRASVAP